MDIDKLVDAHMAIYRYRSEISRNERYIEGAEEQVAKRTEGRPPTGFLSKIKKARAQIETAKGLIENAKAEYIAPLDKELQIVDTAITLVTESAAYSYIANLVREGIDGAFVPDKRVALLESLLIEASKRHRYLQDTAWQDELKLKVLNAVENAELLRRLADRKQRLESEIRSMKEY